ncbi:MAG: hypothetical protein MAG581_00846 [Deltaproteobacteria bacterium]|nr:hypothetical protein [Deltaproteobacteria bacterium]
MWYFEFVFHGQNKITIITLSTYRTKLAEKILSNNLCLNNVKSVLPLTF